MRMHEKQNPHKTKLICFTSRKYIFKGQQHFIFLNIMFVIIQKIHIRFRSDVELDHRNEDRNQIKY